ncbi:uncharacterized protein CTHT_0073750 [Thermochaetoides thermophila DSM 1495]|uniref:Uncharacterized protein n=1 Tax=Chaetomium thermophilum (strain DSM 1495 / CBS 144.50 / IMI 039719) TaxID=759272 RepID=G0SHX9_CHATD|nr:hypothetical protein CTHT_0073750 [Thermochaetoides thermophila DSM 1495]EGS17049.1 hypothetical protein CTHT_0073750 [Thermochaetoides thermophila DSM 1495]
MSDLTNVKLLSFDCYGTLIDWEAGLASDLFPIVSRLPPSHPFRSSPLAAVIRFNDHSEYLWATQPTLSYNRNLSESFRMLAGELSIPVEGDAELEKAAEEIGSGPGRWQAFDDTIAALGKLKKHYKLVVLSNVDEANISRAQSGPLAGFGGFDAVYTAEAIGSYKPSLNNFRYLVEKVKEEFGVDALGGELLHVARSLTADQIPAKEIGLRSVWIARGGDKPEGYGTGGDYEKLNAEGKLGFERIFQTLGEFAEEVERQFAEKGDQ